MGTVLVACGADADAERRGAGLGIDAAVDDNDEDPEGDAQGKAVLNAWPAAQSHDAGCDEEMLEDSGPGLGAENGVGCDAGPGTDADVEEDAGLESDAGPGTDADVEEDAGLESDTGPGTDADVEEDAGLESDAGPGTDADVEDDAGLESDAGGVDPGLLAGAAANPGVWTWVSVPGLVCRDGSSTGVGVRLKPNSRRLTIFLFGGGACFNRDTCAANPSRFGSRDFQQFVGYYGSDSLFSERDPGNPLRDDNFAVVGYCTGDVHAGVREDVVVRGVSGRQQFVGGRNLETIVGLLRPYFAGRLDRVLLTGFSAGGFGSIFSYHRVADAFAPVVVDMIDDSGPVLREPSLNPPCLVDLENDLWGISRGAPANCSACQSSGLGAVLGFYDHLVTAYPEARFGLISSLQDSTIRYFLSFGAAGCTASQDPGGPSFQAGLEDLRDGLLVPTGRWSTFFIPGTSHVAYFDFDQTVARIPLKTWVRDVLDGQVLNVSP